MPAALHHERIAAPDTTPSRWLVLTHGIFGAGMNWRGIARKLTAQRPEWGVILVDLRLHGRSEPGDRPHTVAACAEDVRVLVAASDVPIEAIAGHSFGGKVMMAARALIAPRQTWILDASPSASPTAASDPDNTVVPVLALMESLPATWDRREDFVAALTAAGQPASLANWLAMNVVSDPDGRYRMRLDLAAIRELLIDYNARDLWDAIEAPEPGEVEFVVAGRSSTVSAADRGRLAAAPPHVHVHEIDAGHWLHIDAPAAVVELFAARLSSPSL